MSVEHVLLNLRHINGTLQKWTKLPLHEPPCRCLCLATLVANDRRSWFHNQIYKVL